MSLEQLILSQYFEISQQLLIIQQQLITIQTQLINIPINPPPVNVPLPAPVWMFGTALLGILSIAKRKKQL